MCELMIECFCDVLSSTSLVILDGSLLVTTFNSWNGAIIGVRRSEKRRGKKRTFNDKRVN